jgi:arginine exporter protein ArgO
MQRVAFHFAGITLGLGLIFPIGPINLFVIRQGVTLGWRRAWPVVLAIATNDTILKSLGAIVGTTATGWITGLQRPLMLGGASCLTVLGVRYMRASHGSPQPGTEPAASLCQRILLTIGVVWFNPHALSPALDCWGQRLAPGTRRSGWHSRSASFRRVGSGMPGSPAARERFATV